ncbi:molybdate ABC transporter substrate-binding protein [Sulfitobacter alexandrii]|uniref:Molybdate ABC transporter substrate-binding protein n=1 Tax=Sulfitobacter alexandrii TaxID=1917485 RepID=A0A1J0WIK9_9RHOB|nr:molybdate ABC transporter substrate-binding protein [Sulfitobacter alexandrii]APE44167.1 molybdate ABC transporter substrate-binding protein [Sulfitobacter alexandrii]
MKRLIYLVCVAFALSGPALADRINVFGAASLRGVLEDIAALSTDEIALSFGGSGTMARQAAAGAPVDVIVLASPLWMDWLSEQRVPGADSAVAVARNSLVVIGAPGAEPLGGAEDLLSRLDGRRLAIGQRDAVPAGAYAQAWLRAVDQWETLAPHLAETDNVRAALALVARGEAPLGVVYATDAAVEPRVSVLYRVDDSLSGPIVYPAAALGPAGRPFLDLLQGPEARAIFARHGFDAP